MAVVQKTLFSKNLTNYSVLVNDTQTDSKYFKITQLSDTFTGGKNAFLIAGSEYLVPDTKIQIELVDAAGNIIYHEPGQGMINTNISGSTNTSIITEYFEGVSKVVAVYVYPDTAFGPCTLTILGELSSYESDAGITSIVPLDWENKYNVKWQKQINVNPSLPNTTKIRFYQRPQATITEILNPIYTIVSGSKVASAVTQSFADIKLSKLETFAGDVKRIKVFRTSEGDISDYDLIQDILVESKELLTSYGLTGSVVGNTGTFTSETLKNYWNSGSLNAVLNSERIAAGIRLTGNGNFTYTSSLDIKSANTYELNLDAFYSSSTASNLEIYLKSGSASSSIGKLYGIAPTKNLSDTVIPFKTDKDYISASLYFSQSQGDWHLGNISLKLSQDTAFSPDEISFVTTMPTAINNQTYNFKFEFYDVNNNYVPVAVTQSATFTGGNAGATAKLLTFQTDRSAFRFSTGSYGNPVNQTVKFSTQKTNLTGSVTYASSAFDIGGNYIEPSNYISTATLQYPADPTKWIYPGWFTSQNQNGALLSIASFSGSVTSSLVGSIVYTASCEGFEEYETIYRFEDGDNAPGVFVTSNTNQFIYKATDLSLNPTGQTITIEAKRKNLASSIIPLTINSGSGKPPLTIVGIPNPTNGVDTYTLSGTSYPYSTGETIYSISGSDQFGNVFSDAIKISPVKILDGFSVAVSNENTSFPALSIGTVVGGFAASSGSITVKVGNEPINYSSTFVTNSFSASIDTFAGLTPNTFNGTNYSINTLSADSGSLTLLVKYKDGGGTIISSSKDITYSKVKKAAPVLAISSTPKDQSVTAKSTGEQIDSFTNVTIVVKETYNGSTITLPVTLTATRVDTGGSLTVNNTTGVVTLSNQTLATGINSTTINISAVVTDSEGVSRTITDTLSLSKVKKAVPNVVISATPQAQSVLANAAGTQTGTLSNVTVSALEGTTSRFTTMAATYGGFSTNPTISGSVLTMTGSVIDSTKSEASASIVVIHNDSEGTAGQTQTILTRFTKVNVGTDGDNGSNGTNAKVVVITADNYVVTYDGNGSLSPGGQSVILTATSQNFTTPYYQFTKNGTEVRAYSTTATYTIVTLPSSGTSDLYQVNVKEGNVGSVIAFDNTDIFGVKAGTDSYTVFLTNEAHTLPAANDGTVSSYVGSGTSVIVYKGATQLNGVTTGTPTTGEFKVTATLTTGTITIGGQTSTGNPVIFADHSVMTTDLATITYSINVENLVTITKLQSLSKSKKGDTGSPGNTGNDGKRTATGMIHYQITTGTAPATPTATSYTFSTNAFATLTTNWAFGAPTYASGNSNKYWYSTYTAVETTAGGGTAVPSFSAPVQAIGFTGLVTFTSANKITDGTLESNIVPSGSITNHIGGPNVTTIDGGKISTGTITSTSYTLLGTDTLTSGSYMGNGTIFNLDNSGSIRSKNFYITPQGDAFFKGTLSAPTGNIGGWSIGSTFISASRTLLKNDGVIELRNSEQSVKVTIDGGTSLPDPQAGSSNITLTLPQQGPGTAYITSYIQYVTTTNTITITKTGSYRFRATIPTSPLNSRDAGVAQMMVARLYVNAVDQVDYTITGPIEDGALDYPAFGLNFKDLTLNSGNTVYITLTNSFSPFTPGNISYYVPTTTITGISNVPSVGINQEGFQIIQDSSRYFTIKPSTLDFYNSSLGSQDRPIIGTQSGPLLLNNSFMNEWQNAYQNIYHRESLTPLVHEAAGGHDITSYFFGGKNRAFQIIRAYGIVGTGVSTNWYGTPGFSYFNPAYFWYNVDTVTRNGAFQYTVTFVEPIYSYDTVREGTEYYSVFIGGRGETPGFGLPWVTDISNTGFTVSFYQLEDRENAQFSFIVVK